MVVIKHIGKDDIVRCVRRLIVHNHYSIHITNSQKYSTMSKNFD
jgi:hypothetical protein